MTTHTNAYSRTIADYKEVFEALGGCSGFIHRTQLEKLLSDPLKDKPTDEKATPTNEEIDKHIKQALSCQDSDPIVPECLTFEEFLNFFADFFDHNEHPLDHNIIFKAMFQDSKNEYLLKVEDSVKQSLEIKEAFKTEVRDFDSISSKELSRVLEGIRLGLPKLSEDEVEAMTRFQNPHPQTKEVNRHNFCVIVNGYNKRLNEQNSMKSLSSSTGAPQNAGDAYEYMGMTKENC